MATYTCAFTFSFPSPHQIRYFHSFLYSNLSLCRRPTYPHVMLSSVTKGRTPYKNTLIFEAVRLLGPPARFEASKLKVDFMGEEIDKFSRVIPRTYTLSHCDFTANLTLTISGIIGIEQLQGWYTKDDVVAEWKEVKGQLCLIVHCYVSGPSPFLDLAAEFRYHIFSKELPLVLQAVLHGDSELFMAHTELMAAIVWVYFHSSSRKYNCLECWGPLQDAAQRWPESQIYSMVAATEKGGLQPAEKWRSPKSFFQALFTFLL